MRAVSAALGHGGPRFCLGMEDARRVPRSVGQLSMQSFLKFSTKALVGGFLAAAPVYLAILLLLKAMKSLGGLVRPLKILHPPQLNNEVAQTVLALLILLSVCYAFGIALLTRPGRAAGEWIHRTVLVKIPGYTVVQSLTLQLTGEAREDEWRPALIEIEDGLVPAFIIEEIRDGRYTVFAPSVPSPLMGSIYVLHQERVHPVNASFVQAFQVLSRWGSGTKDLVAAMEPEHRHANADPRPSGGSKSDTQLSHSERQLFG